MLDSRIIQYQESRNQYPIFFGSDLSGLVPEFYDSCFFWQKTIKDNHENTKDCLPWRYVPRSAADLAYVPGLGQGKHEIKYHSHFRVFVLSCFRDKIFLFLFRFIRVRI